MDSIADWVGSPSGGALDFNTGSAEHVLISGFTLDTSGPFTIAWRSKVDAYTDPYPGEFSFDTDQATDFGVFHCTAVASYKPLSFGSQANFVQLHADTDWSAAIIGTWQSYAVTYNGLGRTTNANYTFYRNGLLETTVAAGAFAAGPGHTHIGYGANASVELDGQVDYLQVWAKKLSVNAIQQLSAEPYEAFRPARRWWPVSGAPPAGLDIPIAMHHYKQLMGAN
jgi:hypothetical protein